MQTTLTNVKLAGVYFAPSVSLQNENPAAYNSALAAAPTAFGPVGSCSHCGRCLRESYLVDTDQGRAVLGSKCFENVQAAEEVLDDVQIHARRVAAIKRDRSKTEKRLAKIAEYRGILAAPGADVAVGSHYRGEIYFAADRSGEDMIRARGARLFHPDAEVGELWVERVRKFLRDIDAEEKQLRAKYRKVSHGAFKLR